MDLADATRTLHDPEASRADRVIAAALLAESDETSIEDLVHCLRHRGIVAELAACALYRRTGRSRPKRLLDFADRDQWEQFLIRRRLLAEESKESLRAGPAAHGRN